MSEPSKPPDQREVAVRELIASFEQRSSSSANDLFEVAKKDLSGTKRLVYGGGFSLAAILSTVGGWSMDFLEKQKKQADDIAAISRTISDLDVRMKLLGGQQRQIVGHILGAELLVIDGIGWVGTRLDICRKAKTVKKPGSLADARRRISELSYDRIFNATVSSD